MDEKQLQLLWDSHAKNGGFASFDEFKSLMGNSNSRKVYFDDANAKLGFKDYGEFETILQVKKKVGGENINAPSNGLDSKGKTTSKIIFPEDENDVIGQALKADELANKKISVTGEGNRGEETSLTVIDTEAAKQSEEIKSGLSKKGYDKDAIEGITHDFKDFPQEAFDYPETNKETLLSLRKENPVLYNQRLNSAKVQFAVRDAIYKKAVDDGASEEDAANYAKGQFNYFNDLNEAGNLHQFINNKKIQIGIVNKELTGDERDKALERLQENGARFINPTFPELKQEYEESGLSGKIDIDQYAGLKTLEVFNPEKYQQAVNALGYDVEPYEEKTVYHPRMEIAEEQRKEGTRSKELGKEVLLKQLLEAGRNNTISFLAEKNNTLSKAYDQTEDPEEKNQILEEANNNIKILDGIAESKSNDAKRFPLQGELELDQLAKELTQRFGKNALEYGIERFTKGMDVNKPVENILVSTFFGGKANTGLQLKRLGEYTRESSEETLPSSFGDNTLPFIPQFSDGVKDIAKGILSNKTLTSDEKSNKIKELVRDAQESGDIKYITNTKFGKTRNFLTKASLYHSVGMVADVSAFAAQTYLMGTAGASRIMSAGVPMFIGTQNQFYKEAVAKGISNPGQYANLHAAVMFGAGVITPQLDILKKSFGGTSFGRIIEKVDQKTFDNILSKNKSMLTRIQNSGIAMAKQGAEIAGTYGLGTSIASDLVNKGFFDEKKSLEDMVDDGLSAAKTILMDSAPLLALTGFTHAKSISPAQKSAVWDLGAHHELSIKEVNADLASGKIDAGQAKGRIEVINKVNAAIQEIPLTNKKGKPLDDSQRLDYMYNSLMAKESKDKKVTAEAEIENERIVDPEIANTKLVREYFENDLLGQSSKENLSVRDADGKPTDKFDENKVGEYLKEAAQRINNLDSDWKKNTLGDSEKSARESYPQAIQEIAEKRWAKEIEAAKAEPVPVQTTIESAVIEINGKQYEGKNHAEAILKAKEDGQDISQVDRKGQGKFKLSDGTIIDRAEAKSRFGQDRSELLIKQDEAANNANKEYRKITEAKGEVATVKEGEGSGVDVVGKTYRDNYNRTFEVKGENAGILTLEDVDTGKVLRKKKSEVLSDFKEITENGNNNERYIDIINKVGKNEELTKDDIRTKMDMQDKKPYEYDKDVFDKLYSVSIKTAGNDKGITLKNKVTGETHWIHASDLGFYGNMLGKEKSIMTPEVFKKVFEEKNKKAALDIAYKNKIEEAEYQKSKAVEQSLPTQSKGKEGEGSGGVEDVLYHNTKEGVTKLERKNDDIGIHLGTIGQAKFRGEKTGGKNTIAIKNTIKNPLELPDIEDWTDVDNVKQALIGSGKFSEKDLLGSDTMDEVRETIKEKGYDGIKYINAFEIEGLDKLEKKYDYDVAENQAPGSKKMPDEIRKFLDNAKKEYSYISFEQSLPTQSKAAPKDQAVESKVKELEVERDDKILKEGKPEIKLEFVSAKELVDSKDPVGNKRTQREIIDKYKNIRKLLDCIWA